MKKFYFLIFIVYIKIFSYTFIPMDETQTDHLKSYGIVYRALKNGVNVYWLLNYRGGSFLIMSDIFENECLKEGVLFTKISEEKKDFVLSQTERSVLLEKAPKLAVYSPPGKEPWDDAVTLVLDYANIPYDVIYDKEILTGKVYEYEWIHLHHEDFTGQLDRFYISSLYEPWFQDLFNMQKNLSKSLGYEKYWLMKRDVAKEIKNYISRGGFLFAMCSATNTLDDALALGYQDMIPSLLDGDGTVEPVLDYTKCIAFENFKLNDKPTIEIDDINYEPFNRQEWENRFFKLKKFSPKFDLVEAMLTQNHTDNIKEFLGRTSSFDKRKIKKDVVILADSYEKDYAKYIHGFLGEGFFTFLAGHDPEDYLHFVNDPPTELILFKNSPGYRLILNNVLFPASQEKKKKT
ncbi:MAG: asparagine synthetase B [candidate division WOR-3 bacterium]